MNSTTVPTRPKKISNNQRRLQNNYKELEREALDSEQLLNQSLATAASPLMELPVILQVLAEEKREGDVPKVQALVKGIRDDLATYQPKVDSLKKELKNAIDRPTAAPGDLNRKYSEVLNVSAQMVSLSADITGCAGRSAKQVDEILTPPSAE